MENGQKVRGHMLCEARGEGSRGIAEAEASGVQRAGETFSVAMTGTYLLRSWETD